MESPVLRGDALIGSWCACSVNITGVAITVGGTQIPGIGEYGLSFLVHICHVVTASSNRGPTIRSAYSGPTSKCALHPIAHNLYTLLNSSNISPHS